MDNVVILSTSKNTRRFKTQDSLKAELDLGLAQDLSGLVMLPTPETAQWWFTIAHNNSFNKHLLNVYGLPDIISVLRNWEIVTTQTSLPS